VLPESVDLQFPDDGTTANQDFCFQKTAEGFNDLQVYIPSHGIFRPGFDEEIVVVCKNIGNTNSPATITFKDIYDFGYFISSLPAAKENDGELSIEVGKLLPFQEGTVKVVYKLNPPTDPLNPLQDGDLICFETTVALHDNEVSEDNSNHEICVTLINSYDPNNKTCLDGII